MPRYDFAQSFVVQEQTISTGGGARGLPIQYVLQAPTLEKLKAVLPGFLEKARSDAAFEAVDYDLKFNKAGVKYGDVFREQERQFSAFNFEASDVATLKRQFEDMERNVTRILNTPNSLGYPLVLPAYDHVLKASHLFNLMDARGAIAVAERQSYIGRIRDLCKACALEWVEQERARV